jgi:putative transposase
LSHSYSQNTIHIVFSTYGRQRTIPKDFQPRFWPYVSGIFKNEGVFVHAIGGMDDHLHCLVQLPPMLPLAKAINTVKSYSSKWAKDFGHKFAWQKGYGAFSVSQSNIQSVIRYIDTQEQHHRKMGFEEEFVQLLKKHQIEFDPKYVFG